MSNSLGKLFSVTSFGESHGHGVGVIIDGCPAGLTLNVEDIRKEVDKRKPYAASGQTSRKEEDKVEILSGVFQGHSTGAPIGLWVTNQDVDSSQYEKVKFTPRPGHADYTAFIKYGGFNDYRGGGRFSGRVTAGLVMAGAVAKKLLDRVGIEVLAYTIQIGDLAAAEMSLDDIRKNVYTNPVRSADLTNGKWMQELITRYEKDGDSVGGAIEGLALNVPAGLGEPYFDTLEGEIAKALFAIPAVKGVEFGDGFEVAGTWGSKNNDPFFVSNDKRVVTISNHAGGVLGGISNGMPLVVRVAVKPTPSISQKQKTVDLKTLENTEINIQGRHDACIVPRAVIVVESMIAITLCDLALRAGIIPRIIK
jgi:chorismate synthase